MIKIHNETENLLKLLNNYKISNNNLINNNLTNNKYFMELFDNFKKNYTYVALDKIYIEELYTDPNFYLKDNDFTSPQIKSYILNNLKYNYKLSYENNIIIYYSKKKIINMRLIQHMFQIIIILKNIFNRNNINQTIIYFETNKKKKFPSKYKILGPNEINTGLTLLDLKKNGNIILFRKEEILKVLIHELIHSNLIDEKFIFSNENTYLNKILCSNYNIVLNEAFTETLATILNIYYIHIVKKLGKGELNKMLKNEIKYSNLISSKIFKYYNIEKIDDILIKNKCSNIFSQNTNVFSYYILKNILLNNHIRFGEILDNNSNYYKIKTSTCIFQMIDLINNSLSLYNNNDLNNDLNNNIELNNNSLRLCLYELKF
jgi:hypothetical protein